MSPLVSRLFGSGPSALLGFAVIVPFSGLYAGEPQPHVPGEDRVLLLDRRVVESISNARLEVSLPQKDVRNPLLNPDQLWENATNNYYPNVTWVPEEQRWRLWYKDVLADKDVIDRMDPPSTIHGVGWYLLHAVSRDGVHWEKPPFKLHTFDGNSTNNIVFRDCPNVGVFRDAHDAKPERRYKMVFDVGLGRPRVSFSKDGIHWGVAQEVTGFLPSQGDTHNNAFFDARTGKYLWFTKMYLGERLVSRLESDDFRTWRSSGVVLRSEPEEGRGVQTYAMTVFPYANGYLGYVMLYRVGTNRKVDCELAWSSDSIHWERVAPGTPFLKNGTEGSYDGGCIYAQAGPAVLRDGRIQIYYGGSPAVHAGWKRSGSLCLATIPEDGFAGYGVVDASAPGQIHTTPLRLKGARPSVRAEGTVHTDIESLGADQVRLHFRLEPGAKLFSIHGVELVDTTPRPLPDPAPPVSDARCVRLQQDFQNDAARWMGTESLEHIAGEGCVRIRRTGGQRPIASGTLVTGDWPAKLGGTGVTLSAKVRTPGPQSRMRLEIFAQDIAHWWFEPTKQASSEWTEVHAPLSYAWTDADAVAAGWMRSPAAFSWRKTLRHAGKLVVMPAQSSDLNSFDLKEVSLTPHAR